MDLPDTPNAYQERSILRFTTVGSVDDGKSTLIGRLLMGAHAIYKDQLAAVEKASAALKRDETDLAMFTDGLKIEREQGITIDVAYRQFRTQRRRFIIADTPGHEQYTRNMVTGASTADLAIILLDARLGVLPQSKRHGFIASLLGIPRMIVAVNKMDLVGYSRDVYAQVCRDYEAFSQRLEVKDINYIPISALRGDNIVEYSRNTPWYEGLPLLSQLEQVHTGSDANLIDFRFPVQYVLRPNHSFRGYCGVVASGIVRLQDTIIALPSGIESRVERILVGDRDIEYAIPTQSITLCLTHEIDISRGDMLVHSNNVPRMDRNLEAMLVWMNTDHMEVGKSYLIKHTTHTVPGVITPLHYRIEPEYLHRQPAQILNLNEIGRVGVQLHQPLFYDEYRRNRATGGFVVIDPLNNATLAAGMIIERSGVGHLSGRISPTGDADCFDKERANQVVAGERRQLHQHKPVVLWLTGLSGAGKSTIARGLERLLFDSGHRAYVLDGDTLRAGLNSDLGFSAKDRGENIRRAAEVAHLFANAGVIVIAAFISPFREDRRRAREIIGEEKYVEVFVDAPLEVCEARDVKGLYSKARGGELAEFTGISSPFEPPERPEIRVQTDRLSLSETLRIIWKYLEKNGVLDRDSDH